MRVLEILKKLKLVLSHYLLPFKKLKPAFASIYWIPKIMVQFCYKGYFLGVESVSCHLLIATDGKDGHGL